MEALTKVDPGQPAFMVQQRLELGSFSLVWGSTVPEAQKLLRDRLCPPCRVP